MTGARAWQGGEEEWPGRRDRGRWGQSCKAQTQPATWPGVQSCGQCTGRPEL